jgi:hypothetical protein
MEYDTRTLRLKGRHALRAITYDARCFDCGREPSGVAVSMRRTNESVVGFAGLVSCGRVWLCPVCNAKVMAVRAIEIGLILAWASAEGYQVIWGSLTVRHNAASDLGDLLRIQREAWRLLVSSKPWRNASSTSTVAHVHTLACGPVCERKRETILLPQLGRVGYIRAAELTIGANGWHPHIHPLIFVKGSRELAEKIAQQTVDGWVIGVGLAGGEAEGYGAQQLKVINPEDSWELIAGYMTKQTYDHSKMALEAVWSQGKKGRGRALETVAHWDLLARIETGDMDVIDRWYQLEDAIPGHRMLSMSRGLRSFAHVADEVDDETIAAQEVGSSTDDVCFISPDGWRGIRDRPEVLGQLLEVLAASGWPGLRVLLEFYQVDYFVLQAA